MDPASIALGLAACKKILDTASDIKSVAQSVDQLLHTEEAAEKNKKKGTKPKTRQQQILRMRSHDDAEENSFSEIADEVLTERRNERARQNLFIEIDNRFGKGTVDEIMRIRKERQEKAKKQAKEIAEARAREAAERRAFIKKWSIIFGQVIGVITMIALFVWFIVENRCTSSVC
tara:strand:- start:1421 stop:1945 length:525 start_codon:yes stop_codon:yes gene_type:complete